EAHNLSHVIGFFQMLVFFGCGIAVIVGTKLFSAWKIEEQVRDDRLRRRLMLLDSSSYVLSIFVMILISLPLGLAGSVHYEANMYWLWTGPDDPLSQITKDNLFHCTAFAIAAFFVMMLDVAGSPVEYFRKGGPGEGVEEKSKQKAISRSLRVDSLFN